MTITLTQLHVILIQKRQLQFYNNFAILYDWPVSDGDDGNSCRDGVNVNANANDLI